MTDRYRISVALMSACVGVFAVSMLALSWALYDRFEQTNQRRIEQANVNRQLAEQTRRLELHALDNCREIEKLKAARREIAIQIRKNLPRDLKLLGLEMTPAIRAAANESKFRVLRAFPPQPCPRTGGS